MSQVSKLFLALGAANAGTAVALGAIGAHALKDRLSPKMMSVYHTGSQYHLYHALGLMLVGLLALQLPESSLISGQAGLCWQGRCCFRVVCISWQLPARVGSEPSHQLAGCHSFLHGSCWL